MSETRQQAIKAGIQSTVILAPSYLSFGIVTGVSALQAGFSPSLALLSPAWIFGGSAQVVMTQLIIAGAPLWVVCISAILVNARMMVYSAAFNPLLREASQRDRSLAAAFLVDQSFAAHTARAAKFEQAKSRDPHWLAYYLSHSMSLWAVWLATNALGIFVGSTIPAEWELGFTIPLCFVAIMGGLLRQNLAGLGMLLGAGLSVALFTLPLKLGLIASVVLGVSVLMAIENLRAKHA
jgi:4-azaleucine resistance transporter AzlC